MRRAILAAAAVLGLCGSAAAQTVYSWTTSIEDVSAKHSRAAGLGFEVASAPRGWHWRAGVMTSADRDLWVGVGGGYTFGLGGRGFLELSFMPGLFRRGQTGETYAPHFRSGVALGFDLEGGASVALTFSHRSNGGVYGLYQAQGGSSMETVGIRWSWTLQKPSAAPEMFAREKSPILMSF
jgi:hypothetical protein